MRALHIKLLRELRRLWAQVIAIALVMAAGVATMIIGVGTYQSLANTRDAYYETHRFADVFAAVTRAPRPLLDQVAEIDGVLAVEGRIERVATADIEGVSEPASVLLVSLPRIGEPLLNRIYLRNGRLPDGPGEAVVSEVFARSNALVPGSSIKVLINGTLRAIAVTGIALSPDFIYAMAPGEMLPDEHRFGVLWMQEAELAAAYGLEGAFSNLSLRLLPGASQPQAIETLDELLAPYGGRGAYGRDQQISHVFLESELIGLQAMSQMLPPVFLLVAAFLVNITLSRLISLEREQIGLMKALGYSSWAVARHYVELVLLIALVGCAVGFVGGYWLGTQLTLLYAKFYSFPLLLFSRDPATYVLAAGTTMGAGIAGAINAVRKAAWLPPAVAMSPPAPPDYRKVVGNGLRSSLPLRQTTVVALRHLLRWPWRSAGGVLGVALSVAILVGSLWTVGAMEHMIQLSFNRADRQDATLAFQSQSTLSALFAVERLPGVIRAEPYRAVGVEVSNGQISRRVAIIGRPLDADLSRVIDEKGHSVLLPESGLVLSKALADILAVPAGGTVWVRLLEGDRREFEVPISDVVEGFMGLGAYMELDALNRLVGDDIAISGANLTIDPVQQANLFSVLKRTPSAGYIALQSIALKQFRKTQVQNLFVMMGVLVGLAGLIAFGVVYNFARISLSEQGREMASLRVLGFTRGEVSSLLLGEIAIVTLLAQPLGWAIGYLIALAMVAGFSNEVYRMALILGPDVYAYSSLIVCLAAVVSGLVVRRRVDRLDMIAVLKTRE